ncbi:hypothetical protein SAMN03159341_106354 [Paenibacillus sp. 1_12]|nr:hypothetical protein SAMN03159341_106354 [Paenibacillus sp. 1_12]
MNRHVFYIVISAFTLIFPICTLLYGLWDANQPKIGDGVFPAPSFLQLIPIFCGIFIGITNLPIAIIRYLKYKKTINIHDKSA